MEEVELETSLEVDPETELEVEPETELEVEPETELETDSETSLEVEPETESDVEHPSSYFLTIVLVLMFPIASLFSDEYRAYGVLLYAFMAIMLSPLLSPLLKCSIPAFQGKIPMVLIMAIGMYVLESSCKYMYGNTSLTRGISSMNYVALIIVTSAMMGAIRDYISCDGIMITPGLLLIALSFIAMFGVSSLSIIHIIRTKPGDPVTLFPNKFRQ